MATKGSTERAAELAALIARRSTLPPHQIAAHVCHLQRIARQAVTIAMNLCNVPDYQLTYDRRITSLRSHSAAICLLMQPSITERVFSVEIGGDPRGCCLHICIEDKSGDGGAVYAVY